MKIWSGSAASEGDNSAYDFMVKKDINVDAYLVRYEALHLLMYNFYLYNHGIIKKEDAKKIFIALIKAYEDGIKLNESLEDVHGNMEYYIIENAGEAGRNLRMFMSRNEQVHTDFNFFAMETLLSFQKSILETVKVINNIRQDGVLPGYTHFRQAMPIRYSTYLNYISEIFTSAFYRLNDVFNDLLELPLGYGSGFGSVSGVDFGEVASYIGMKKNIRNPLFESTRYIDTYINIISVLNQFLIDISRIFQDLIIFSGDEMGIIRLPPGYVTGSSLMPNKVNPDFLEIFQGYVSRSISLASLIYSTTINKTPGYHRDFQIIKDEFIPFLIDLKIILNGMPALFNGIEFDSEKAINMIKNTTYATYNSRLEFNKTQNWKEAYKDTGNKIRNGIQLQDYIPEAETDHLDTKKMDDVLRENEKFIYSNINDFIKKIKKIVES